MSGEKLQPPPIDKPADPPGRVAVTRIDISRASALFEAALFPVPFVLMVLYFVWKALTDGVSSIVSGMPVGLPDWSKWLVLVGIVVGITYVSWLWATVKRVTLVGDRLLIAGLTASADVPLNQVQSLQWIQSPDESSTLVARLLFSVPTAVGTEIRFEPKSAATFELLRSKN